MRAAAYIRVSSESQVDNWSIPAQKRELEEYCQQKSWQLVRMYSEEGLSAHSDSIEKRPQFRRLLDDCKKGEFEVVLVHSLDRWSRNLRVTLETFKILADSRIAFVSITENIDYSSPEGRLFVAMLGAFAQYYSDSLSKHTSKGMKQRAVSGLQNGDVPFGYQKCTEACVPEHKGAVHMVEREAEAVKRLFQLYAIGGWSLSKLADWLNEQGFRTRNKKNLMQADGSLAAGPMPFTLYSVRWLLHNPFFSGKVRYRGQLYKGAHEAVIDEKLYDQVQEKLAKAKSRSATFSPSFRLYLLKGVARCVYCGYPLWSETAAAGYGYYREQRNSHANSKCPANGKSIRCKVIDGQIESIIKSLALEPSWRERIVDKLSNLSEHEQATKQKKQIREKLRRLAKAYVDGIVDDADYNVQRILLQDNFDSLVVPEADAALNAGELLETLGLVWEKATLEEKHRLISGMLEAVYVDLAATRSIVGIQPKPAFYPLFESLKQKPDNKVMVFNPGEAPIEIVTGSGLTSEPGLVMVETGESRTPRPIEATRNLLQDYSAL